MFRTFSRRFSPNPFERMLKRAARKQKKKILLGWNRGLGDIALGLYAIIQKIYEHIPDAEITFVTRKNLQEGFSMLEKVNVLIDPTWKREEECTIQKALQKDFDLVIEKPNPTDWLNWQIGKVVPRLKWDMQNESLFERFSLTKSERYIGVQVMAETNYGLWRNWPVIHWQELFDYLEQMGLKVVLFGFGQEPKFTNRNLIDLRGKTTLFELLSIIKNRIEALILPDSGISSMIYYLDEQFPLKQITLWADPNHGILKQNVASPNRLLAHYPLIAKWRDLSTVKVSAVLEKLFPPQHAAAIILSGGLGTRLGLVGAKGLFKIAGKTLFEWKIEKIPKHCPIAIMTSPLNHQEIVDYFEKNGYFGRNIHFFSQEMQRFLNQDKKPMELKGPNGNGSVFVSFVRARLDLLFQSLKIKWVVVSNIENPLSHPIDPVLIELCKTNDAVVQCIEKKKEDRSMGVVVEDKGRVQVREYIHLDGSGEYSKAYSGQMAFDFSFFCEMAKKPLPIHWVRKKIENRFIFKGEKFIFDALDYTTRIKVFCALRKTCYAPIKSMNDIVFVEKILREL